MKEISRTSIKWVAMATMFIDHLRFLLTSEKTMSAEIISTCLFGLGRLAFPLFAYLLVDGFFRTRSKERFFVRLFVFAVISEVPFDLMRSAKLLDFSKQNVMWTLLFGFGAMWLLEGIRKTFEERKRFCILMQALVSVVAMVFGFLAHTDYSYVGVACVLTIYFCRKAEHMFPAGFPIRADMMGYIAGVMLLLINSEMEMTALFGLLLIWNFHGKAGERIPKFFGYGFYPLHMLLIVVIRGLLFPNLNFLSLLHL